MKKIINKILYPSLLFILFISIISYGLLIYIFVNKINSIINYITYVLSFYALTILVLCLIKNGKNIKMNIKNKVMKYKVVEKYITDYAFKANVSLVRGLAIDFLYSLFKLITGIIYSSIWFLSLAFYHIILGLLKLFLFKNYKDKKDNQNEERKVTFKCGFYILILNLSMAIMVALMIINNDGFSYPNYIIYVNACYTFYILILAIVNVFKYKKIGSPILTAAKTINFIASLMSMLGLQTAMISMFGNDDNFRFLMNTIFGISVIISVLIISVIMIVKSKKYGENYE